MKMNQPLEYIVRELDQELLEKHRADHALFARLTTVQRETGILYGDRPTCPFLRPYFLSRKRYDSIAAAAEGLHTAFERLTAAALEHPGIMTELGLTEKEERLARIDPRYSRLCVSSRFDTFLHGDDFKFLEYNAENPAGVGDSVSFEKIFSEIPELNRFLKSNPHWWPEPHHALLEALDSAYREQGGRKSRPTIAIVDWEGVSTYAEFTVLQKEWTAMGYITIIVNPWQLEYDGQNLRVEDFVVDIIYKRVVIHEFLEQFDETHPIVQAYQDGNVLLANNFRVKIAQKKTCFAILTDERYAHLFTSGQRELIHRHIPWTRRVRECRTLVAGREIDLMDYLRAHREQIVIKPHDEYGGKGIRFGWEHTPSEWDAHLEYALAHCFVAQEKVPAETVDIPAFGPGTASIQTMHADFSPFLFGGFVHGGLVRLSSQSLVNITQGGGETALVVM